MNNNNGTVLVQPWGIGYVLITISQYRTLALKLPINVWMENPILLVTSLPLGGMNFPNPNYLSQGGLDVSVSQTVDKGIQHWSYHRVHH